MTWWRDILAAIALVACLSFDTAALAHPRHEPGERGEPGESKQSRDGTPQVSIDVRDGFRYITSNGLPDHEAGQFPNRNNPNQIGPQDYRFRVPVNPHSNDQPTPVRGQLFGVAVNGIVFDPGTAEFWNDDPSSGWRMEAIGGQRDLGLDANNAHVQPTGAYHYHAVPTGLIEKLAGKGAKRPVLIGWAADGFPIYGPWGYTDPKDPKSAPKKLRSSYRLKDGERPDGPGGRYDGSYTRDWEYVEGSGDLDECNGRFGVTPEFPDGTYYYVVTEEYPFIPRHFRGTPDESFQRERGGPPGSGQRPRGGPPGDDRGPRRGGPPPHHPPHRPPPPPHD